MKRRWKILLGLAAALGLLAVLLVFAHFRAKWAVETYRRYLRSQGGKLDIAELIPPPVPAESNGAPALIAAWNRLARVRQFGPMPSMRVLGPGHVLSVWTEAVLPAQNSANTWPALGLMMESNRPALAAIRAALTRPALKFKLDYLQGFELTTPGLATARNVSEWLATAVLVDLHAGRTDGAWENLRACVALLRLSRGEPLRASQTSRLSILRDALGVTWQTLQCPGVMEPQWAELQRDWESFNLLDDVAASLAMERAFRPGAYAAFRSSYRQFIHLGGADLHRDPVDDVGQALANPLEAFGSVMSQRPHYWLWKWWWSYEDELSNLQIFQVGLAAAQSLGTNDALPPVLREFDQRVLDLQAAHPGAESRFILGGSFEPAAGIRNYLLRMAGAETQRRMVVTAIALRRYQLRHGAWPADLAGLTPEFLRDLPVDLMDGKPLRYRPAPGGGFLLYSVGDDGMDNGGDATPLESARPRYQTWWRARDAVWPSPATPGETRAYEETARAEFSNRQLRFGPGTNSPALSNAPPVATTKTN